MSGNFTWGNASNPVIATIVDGRRIDTPEDALLTGAIVKLFLEKGLDLDIPIRAVGGPTLRRFLLSKCMQNHKAYPRYNAVIDVIIAYTKEGMASDLRDIIANTRVGDIENCKAYLDKLTHS